MNSQEKLKYIEDYLEKHFDDWLIKDMKLIMGKNLDFTFPYILLVSAGIDFMGGLKEGFKKNNSTERSKNFIKEWMREVNDLYKDDRMSNIIYKSARCGSSHQAIYKKEVESSSWLYPEDKHLNHMKCLDGTDKIFIHAWQFVNDFIEAQTLFREQYIKVNADQIFDNLQEMLKEGKISGFNELVEDLKNNGKTFDAEEEINNNPRVESYDKETRKIIGIVGNKCTPSGCPGEKDVFSCTTTGQPTTSTITTIPDDEDTP